MVDVVQVGLEGVVSGKELRVGVHLVVLTSPAQERVLVLLLSQSSESAGSKKQYSNNQRSLHGYVGVERTE